MSTNTRLLEEIVEEPDVGIIMSDGCRLSARIWMPHNASTQPVPAILEYLPYRKRDGTIYRDELTHPYFAARGYACIRVDMRGNGESQGLMKDEYLPQELLDACEVIKWATEQNWCNGNVGMMGISWGGFNSLQVAALQPPGLKAIVTVCSTVDRFADDIHYKGGCLLNENIGWAANMLSYSSRPPDPTLVGDEWMAMWKYRLEHMPFLASTWLRHQSRDAYWQHGSVCEDYAAIKAAVLTVGGWHDGYRNTIAHLVENLDVPVKGIVGPWIHKYPHYAAPQPAIGFLQESLRWWDRWLKNIDTGVEQEADYRVWLMDSVEPKRWLDERPGRWVGEPSLPSPNITDDVFYIKGSNGNAVLSGESAKCQLSVSTAQHCGSTCGEYFPFTFGPELPDNQLADDALSICVDSNMLDDALDIIGAPTIQLTLASDKPKALIVARLCDLRPDGTSALITMGVFNLAHRESFTTPSTLTPGIEFTMQFALDQIAYRIPAGHRLRIALSTCYWPFIWPSPESATLSLSGCCITLPIKTDQNDIPVTFEPPERSPEWQAETLRVASSTRELEFDNNTNEHITSIRNDFGAYKDLHHGLINDSVVSERWSVKADDPLSACGDIHWEQSGGRGDWQWKTYTGLQARCDAKHIYVTASLTAHNNGEVVFYQSYSDTIERMFF